MMYTGKQRHNPLGQEDMNKITGIRMNTQAYMQSGTYVTGIEDTWHLSIPMASIDELRMYVLRTM